MREAATPMLTVAATARPSTSTAPRANASADALGERERGVASSRPGSRIANSSPPMRPDEVVRADACG